MNLRKVLFIVLVMISCNYKNEKTDKNITNKTSENVYHVHYVQNSQIKVDGKPEENAWHTAETIKNFTLPWEAIKPQKTEFKALYNKDYFYFLFYVTDTSLVMLDSVENEEELVKEDRVEIYFAFDEELNQPYYCVEIDAKGRILDYKATYPRIFDFKVNWGVIKTATTITDNNYIVEASISLSEMRKLGYSIEDKTKLKVAVFRADFEIAKNDSLIKHWQTWLNPDEVKPNYHVPASFGDFIFSIK